MPNTSCKVANHETILEGSLDTLITTRTQVHLDHTTMAQHRPCRERGEVCNAVQRRKKINFSGAGMCQSHVNEMLSVILGTYKFKSIQPKIFIPRLVQAIQISFPCVTIPHCGMQTHRNRLQKLLDNSWNISIQQIKILDSIHINIPHSHIQEELYINCLVF